MFADDDQNLLRRLRKRDPEAFSQLVSRHHGSMLRFALTFVSSRGVAEEVVQEAWLAVLDGLDRFEGRASLKTWIFRIVANRGKTRGAREKRTQPFSSFSSEAESHDCAVSPERFKSNGMWGAPPVPWDDDSAERLLMTKQGLESVQRAVLELPPGQRAVVTLRDLEGLDSDEICNVLGISETNQRVLLHRARSKLRAVLEECIERGS